MYGENTESQLMRAKRVPASKDDAVNILSTSSDGYNWLYKFSGIASNNLQGNIEITQSHIVIEFTKIIINNPNVKNNSRKYTKL